MTELRQDPITGEWVAIAIERAQRAGALLAPPPPPGGAHGTCPFCPGAEPETPPELERLRLPGDDAPWRVRVVPNRFPAFTPRDAAAPAPVPPPEPFACRPGPGHHELVVETPRHDEAFHELAPAHAALVLEAWQRRYRVLARQPGMRCVVVFKNHGRDGGATIAHAHSQALALGAVPQRVEMRQAHARRTGGGMAHFARLLERERALGTRLVFEASGLAVLQPYAPRWPYETLLLPDDGATPFEALAPGRLRDVAAACLETVRLLRAVVGPFDYNLLLCTPALDCDAAGRFPWHLQIVPRLVQPGGFEMSTDLYINPVPPEQAAERLRAARMAAAAG